jgi:hypothetical protein
MIMIGAPAVPLSRPVDLPLQLPLAWFALVLVGSVVWVLLGGPDARPVPSGMYGRYLFWQSGVLAATVFTTVAAARRMWGLVALGAVLTLFGVGSEMLALPLNLYACSEWVRVARETGVFTLW